LALGVFVLLFGVWYCYKRGKEERLKDQPVVVPEILVEGATDDGSTDHGDRIHEASGSSTPQVEEAPVPVAGPPVAVATPPVEAEKIEGAKKSRKSWFRGAAGPDLGKVAM
jgi:hypothetical protein